MYGLGGRDAAQHREKGGKESREKGGKENNGGYDTAFLHTAGEGSTRQGHDQEEALWRMR